MTIPSKGSAGLTSGKPERDTTAQEVFWEGDFGRDYTERNVIDPATREPFFQQILEKAPGVRTVCELGANRGHNLVALRNVSARIGTTLDLSGVELNPNAVTILGRQDGVRAIQSSLMDFRSNTLFDLVYTCGVLIHLDPSVLPVAYQQLYDLSARYILMNEYFNPTPVTLEYRGHEERLFKRDFGLDFLTQHGSGRLRVVDYGFLWQVLEPAWNNTTWWLFEKV